MVAKTSPLLIIASHNTGKIKEFQQVQPQADFAVTEAEETGSTFVENALIKARHACLQTGHAALADDSGLVVPALGGAPGLRSARYSGSGYEDNNTLLLNNMAGLQGANRHAFYIAVLVLLRDAQDPTPLIAEGRWQGRIANVPRGEGGFGYDPIFIPEGGSLHAAEMTPDEKNRISHRAKAISTLLALADD